ncbi:MAG TPA: ribonuclease Y, partial [Ruminococcaceae bacterium]|nr:ribonuclease Y [Oscillospiraceae bacterium]
MNTIGVVVLVIVCAVGGFLLGMIIRKLSAEGKIKSAEEEARRIVDDALKEAENKKKEAVLGAKDELHRMRGDAEKEIRDRRSEVSRQERRLIQKEESVDRKLEQLEQKEETISKKNKTAQEKLDQAEDVKKEQLVELERISGLTVEQAKESLLKRLEDELAYEKSIRIKDHEQEVKDESDAHAREIITTAV